MKFEDLIAPMSLAGFKLLFEERPEYRVWQTQANPDLIFGWSDLNLVLSQQRINDIDVVILRNGEKVDTQEVTEKVRRKFITANQLNSEKLLAVLKTGGAIRISRIDEKLERLESMAIDVERVLGCQVNINLYAGFGSVPALPVHTDTHDVLVVQLEGKKVWDVFGFGDDPFPIRHPAESDCPTNTVWTGELKKGNMLFMPRGSWHKARVINNVPSLHITIGFNHVMLHTFPAWLEKRLSRYPIYQEHLLGWKTDNDTDTESRIRQVIGAILAPGFLSQFRENRRELVPKRFMINLPNLES